MISSKFALGGICILLFVQAPPAGAEPVVTAGQSSVATAATRHEADVPGDWSGTFHSRFNPESPFVLALKIGPNGHAHIVGKSGITRYCLLRDMDLIVTVSDSDVAIAGADELGNTITFEGTIDKAGRQLTLSYVTNGSTSAQCESDNGTVTLIKR